MSLNITILYGGGGIFQESITSEKFDYITALDVIEHIENEKSFLERIKMLLNNNGKVLLTVPAYQWLYCQYDKEAGHFRRYSKTEIKNLMETNGFIVENITYFNTFLFPIFVPARLITSLFKNNKKSSVVKNTDKSKSLGNIIPYKIFNIEYFLLKKGIIKSFPFGSSVLIKCRIDK